MSIARSSLKFSVGTLLSRITGMLREMIIASVFGASTYLDAFLIANRIPNLFRDMLAEGALGSAFTKVFTSIYDIESKRALKLFSDFIILSLLLTIIITIIGILFAPYFVSVLTLLTSQTQKGDLFFLNTVNITKVVFPFLGLAILNSIIMGVLYQQNKFFISALSSSLLNIGYIIGATILGYLFFHILPQNIEHKFANRAILGLAIGVLLGGILQIIMQIYFIWKSIIKKCEWTFTINFLYSKDVKHVIKLMLPAAIASSAGTINILINTNFATMLQTGAVSWLNYAFHLIQLPVGLFGVAIGSVAIPSFTKALSTSNQKVDSKVSQEFQAAIELVLWFMIPSCIFLLLNSLDIVKFLYEHGKFDSFASHKTSQALFAYSFGIVAYGLIKVLTSFYYAVERTSYAMKVSIISILINLIFNILLVKRYGHVGLATTSSITLTINALLLIIGLKPHKLIINKNKLFKTIILLSVGIITYYILSKGLNIILCNNFILKKLSFNYILNIKIKSLINLSFNIICLLLIFIILAYINFKKYKNKI